MRKTTNQKTSLKVKQGQNLTLNNVVVFGERDGIAKSGSQGGTPMFSRPGMSTIASYLCFSNGVKQKPYEPTDPMDFTNRPLEEIQERIKKEIGSMGENSEQA